MSLWGGAAHTQQSFSLELDAQKMEPCWKHVGQDGEESVLKLVMASRRTWVQIEGLQTGEKIL